MDKNDADTIIRALPELTKMLDLNNGFLQLLLEYRVFNREMIDDILRSDSPPLEFCLMLVKRGPNAFGKFIQALRETNQLDILPVLETTRSRLSLPPAQFIPQRSNPISSSDTGNGEFTYPPIYSTSPPNNAEFRRKVLEPARYAYEAVPSPPDSPHRRTSFTSVTDAMPDWENLMNIKVTLATEVKGIGQDIYPNSGIKPRGLALIMNFKDFNSDIVGTRVGSDKDVMHLDMLLQQLGYKVVVRSNLNQYDALQEIDQFTKDAAHGYADSTVVAVMSHGKGGNHEQGTLIYARDCKFLSSEDILRRFNNVNCPLLKGKPKVFLFQFCRGDNIDIGVRNLNAEMQPFSGRTVTDGNPVLPVSTEIERAVDDMLIAYSTLPGFVSYREESEGTWFIKAICLIFMRDAHECHVDRLFQIVDKQIQHWTGQRNGKQTLEITRRGFNRKFYFNPGLWRDQS